MNPLQRHHKNPKSLRRSIDAHCYQCQGEDADPCFQWRIGSCEITTCALYPNRPYQRMEGNPIPASLVIE